MRWLPCLLLLLSQHLSLGAQQPAKIEGRFSRLKTGDTVRLIVYDYGYFEQVFSQHLFAAVVADHHFSFNIPTVQYPHYVQIIPSQQSLTTGKTIYALLEGGDSIWVDGNDDGYTFSGRGAAKFAYEQMRRSAHFSFWGDVREIRRGFESMDSINSEELQHLELHRSNFSDAAFSLLVADLMGGAEVDKGLFVTYHNILPDSLRRWLSGYHSCNKIKLNTYPYPDRNVLQYASVFAPAIIQGFKLDGNMCSRQSSVAAIYDSLVHYTDGGLRSRLLTSLICRSKDIDQDISGIVRDALCYITAADCRPLIEKIRQARTRGIPAFAFSLPDMGGTMHSLENMHDKVVVLDFWFTGCFSCRKIAPYLKKVRSVFYNKEVVFVSISVDADRQKWMNSVLNGEYGPPDALHLFTEGKGVQHEMIDQYNITAYPTLLMINKKGKLEGIPPDPRTDNGTGMINLIDRLLSE